ncbi:unnamed protein product [Didymodactylos carnosus]|uniref:Uncharacterized protein n=1 Tax=Didymodactylos carnosus TaxID=1234261 RepID=A0A815TEQ7_9BILA|nr:unnamed protein product [Didymodactylos carnosus]CAF1500042.1 unnamed protein product [Didymodactylos carnosus]CAF3721481.1 unnamed protein product [Didymodactylos carnosus]CAF4361784.1 unnamed protein product [Didymodactylos carnosus]
MGPARTPGHRKAQCKYCSWCLNLAKVNMMYSHIAFQCDEINNYDSNARKEVISKLRDLEQQTSPGRYKRRAIEMMSDDSLSSKQYTMDRFTSRIIAYSEQQSIDRYLLRAIIMNGISFRTVNNSFFLEFVKKLNPSYDLPDRKKLAHESSYKN